MLKSQTNGAGNVYNALDRRMWFFSANEMKYYRNSLKDKNVPKYPFGINLDPVLSCFLVQASRAV